MSDSNDFEFQSKRPRPVSTMALNFSEQLDGLFNLGGEIPTLMSGIEDRKTSVNNSSRELQELEARIKAMEERLKRAASGGEASAESAGDSSGAQQLQAADAAQDQEMLAAPRSAVSSRPSSSSRPQVPLSAPPPPPPGRAPPVPGNGLPTRAPPPRPTNSASRTGYDGRMMSDASAMRDHGEYGVAH